jgi:molybdopterin molybdotransferase
MRDMLGRGEALSVQEALRLVSENLNKVPKETLSGIEGSLGRVLSRDIVSSEDIPGYSRSTMDGFAVVSSDTFGAKETSPAYLNVRYEILMGEEPSLTLQSGEAAKISTGGMLPPGADAVLMLEHAQTIGGDGDDFPFTIEALRPVAPGENVIRKGEDVKTDELVLKKGCRLRPQDLAVLASLGLTKIHVYNPLLVSVISTGDEIVAPNAPLKPGQVRDCNSSLLAGLLLKEGAAPQLRGIVMDDFGLIKSAVERGLEESDMILISGGSSVGTRDMTSKVMSNLGNVLFHSVAMKPGKPLIAGMLSGKPVFGLPGHPRAVAVCFDVFVRPALMRMSGQSETSCSELSDLSHTVSAKLSKAVRSFQGREENVCIALRKENGELWAEPLLGKSGLISTMVRADGSINIPTGKLGMDKGETVQVRLLH